MSDTVTIYFDDNDSATVDFSSLSREELVNRIRETIITIFEYGTFDGAHHKMYTLDQALRNLLGDSYQTVIHSYENPTGSTEQMYDWETGIAP